jgi:hypothetical protein
MGSSPRHSRGTRCTNRGPFSAMGIAMEHRKGGEEQDRQHRRWPKLEQHHQAEHQPREGDAHGGGGGEEERLGTAERCEQPGPVPVTAAKLAEASLLSR